MSESENVEEKDSVETSEDIDTSKQHPEGRPYTETELKAIELGWQADFQGDENKTAKTAEQFLELQPLYDDLRKKNRTIRQLDDKVKALDESHKKIAKLTRERTLAELKAQKKAAYEEGDTDKIIEVDDKIRDLDKEEEQEAQPQQNNEAMAEAYQGWVAKNPWYENDSDLKDVADALGAKLGQEDPSLLNDPEEFLNTITERVKKISPEKFKGTARKKPAVEGDRGGSGGGNSDKYSIKSLDPEMQAVAKEVLRTTGMDEKDYMRQVLGETS